MEKAVAMAGQGADSTSRVLFYNLKLPPFFDVVHPVLWFFKGFGKRHFRKPRITIYFWVAWVSFGVLIATFTEPLKTPPKNHYSL